MYSLSVMAHFHQSERGGIPTTTGTSYLFLFGSFTVLLPNLSLFFTIFANVHVNYTQVTF